MPLLPDQLADFVQLTLRKYKKETWTDLSLSLQNYYFDQILKRGMVKEISSHQIDFKVQVSNQNNFRDSELYDVDVTGRKDVMQAGQVPWTKQTTNMPYDVDEEALQEGPERIISEMKLLIHQLHNVFYDEMETRIWTAPSGPDEAPRKPYGIPYWIVKNSTEGHTGGAPSGWTTVGGINPTTYDKWKNWSALYVNKTRADLIAKMRTASVKCRFMSPHAFPETTTGKPKDSRSYVTTYGVIAALEELTETRNDNLGTDLGKYMGSVLFRGKPLEYCAYLDVNDTSEPIYGIDWSKLAYYVKKGRDRYMYPAMQAPNQHTVKIIHMDNWCNFVCFDRREQFVLYHA